MCSSKMPAERYNRSHSNGCRKNRILLKNIDTTNDSGIIILVRNILTSCRGKTGKGENMEDMTMTEIARLIEGLRSAGWEEKKINDFLLYIESGSEEYKPKEDK